MTHISRLGGRMEPLVDPLPRLTYRWDPETEILSGCAADVLGERGLTGSIELEDAQGAVVTLDFAGGIMRGIEVVVWPASRTNPKLRAPAPNERGRFVVPTRPSQPGIAVVEVDTVLSAESSPDEGVIHLRVGPARPSTTHQLAENLLMDIDPKDAIAGFWLLDVPPFPTEREIAD